ncbi:phage holin family protein [Bacillus infantis]|uniref:phage holin family protein n=1 Tax=Bacillus infantis TaxID=324767 RepID=UPI00321C2766
MEVAGIKGIGALLTSFLAYILGIINEAVVVLIFFMFLDMGTGLLRSWLTKSWNSTVGMAGIIKKVAIVFLVGMAGGVEYIIASAGQDSQGLVVLGVTSFFIVNEGISILENCAQLGLPIPPILYTALEKLNREPVGKEHLLERNPQLERLDKAQLIKEVEVLQKEILVEKKEENKEA